MEAQLRTLYKLQKENTQPASATVPFLGKGEVTSQVLTPAAGRSQVEDYLRQIDQIKELVKAERVQHLREREQWQRDMAVARQGRQNHGIVSPASRVSDLSQPISKKQARPLPGPVRPGHSFHHTFKPNEQMSSPR